jgi:hypothetical protein
LNAIQGEQHVVLNKLLAEVPARIWEDGRPPGLNIWNAEFNVAGWIKASGAKGEISLLLCHEDEAGKHCCVVDRCTVSDESNNLMSGQVNVRFTGMVKKVQMILKLPDPVMQMHSDSETLILSDPVMRVHVEELFVQRKDREMRRENKLISRT